MTLFGCGSAMLGGVINSWLERPLFSTSAYRYDNEGRLVPAKANN